MPKLTTHKITCFIVSKVHKSFILTKELRWKCVTVVYQLVHKHLIAYSLHFLIQFTPTQRIIFHKNIWNFTFDSSLITVVLFRYLFPRTILIQPSRLVSIRHLYIINVKKILSLTFTYKIYTVSQKVFFYSNEADTPTARTKIKSRPNEIHKIEKSLKMMYCLTCIALTFGL